MAKSKDNDQNNPSLNSDKLSDFSDLSNGTGLTDFSNLKDTLPTSSMGGSRSNISKNPQGNQQPNSTGQSANRAASAGIDKMTSGGSGGKADATGKALDHLSNETPEEKAEREGKLSNTALKGGGAAAGAAIGGTEGAKIGADVGTFVSQHKGAVAGVGVAIVLIALIPIFLIIYLIQNPWDAVKEVLTNSKLRSFGIDVASAFANNTLKRALDTITYTGEVEYHGPNTAIAATQSTVTPGTTLEKLSQIDWAKSQYQTLDNSTCGYTLKLKKVVNAQGTVRSVPESVTNKRTGATIPLDQLSNNQAASYCIQKQYPIFNMMARQPVTRQINGLADVHLDYASKKDTAEFKQSKSNVDKYVYNKTLARITPTKDSTINFAPYQETLDKINQVYKDAVKQWNSDPNNEQIPISEANTNVVGGINKMYEDMAAGKSPYDLNVADYINIPTKVTPNDTGVYGPGLAATMCPFVLGFLGTGFNPSDVTVAENARAAIESRLQSTQRGAMKVLTLADTRKADQLSNIENNATIVQQDNWASSTAYQLDVYDQLRGVQQNPEASSTRAYNARQDNSITKGAISGMYAGCTVAGIDTGIAAVDQALRDSSAQVLLAGYNVLREQIKNESPGVFTNVNDLGTEQIMTAFMRTGSVTAVSGLEEGPDNYNRQAAGFRQLMNDYFLKIGGRFLTAEEATQEVLASENVRRTEEKDRGVGYRLFASENIRSARSIIAQNTITPKTAMTAGGGIFKQLLNPLRSLADIHSSTLYFAFGQHNRAIAASDINSDQYLKIDTAGIPEQDFNIDMLENASVIENIKANGSTADKARIANYDACFAAKIPTSQYFSIKTVPETGSPRTQFFEFFPEKQRTINARGDVIPGNAGNAEFDKFLDCKVLLQDARDFNVVANQLPIRYRMYTYYNTILDMMVSLSSDEDNPSIYANSGTTATPTPVGGNVQELATQILNTPNITFDPGIRIPFELIAAGGPAPTTCGNAGTPTTDVDPKLLQAILEASAAGIPLRISSLTGGCHTDGSDHYTGHAVDIGNEEVGDELNSFLTSNKERLNLDQILWRVEGHFNHLHFSTRG